MSSLHEAAESGDLTKIHAALEAGTDINARDVQGRTPAMVATYARQTEAARLLFARGADPNQRDDMLNNPFLLAAAEGMLDILIAAAEAGADPAITNRYGGVAIIPAAERGHVDVIRYLIDQTRIDVNHVNNLGWTALIEAIILNDGGAAQQDVVRMLIAGGADVNLPDAEGVTPLGHARQRNLVKIEQILIDAEAHV